MAPRIVLLTTDTTHHLYFASKVSEKFPLRSIFMEKRRVLPKFETSHPFETLRDAYERDVLLAGLNSSFSDLAETSVFESVNDAESVSALQALSPHVILVFGTGKLNPLIIQAASSACLNLHGGNPERYRGLDTHLWAIYHRDFKNLVTTLHFVDEKLDTGDIVAQSQLKLYKGCELYELRSINTKACVELTLFSLACLAGFNKLPARPQLSQGRYYSFMPSSLKEDCLRKFREHTATYG